MRFPFGFGAVLLSAALASAQTPNWTRTSSAFNMNPHPAVRDGGGMVYDPIHQQSILFGGLGGGTQGPTSRNDNLGVHWRRRLGPALAGYRSGRTIWERDGVGF
jgi:hypothetical protein